MAITISEPMVVLIWVLLFVAGTMIAGAETETVSVFEKQISEESLAGGLYYSTQAIPCLSRNPDALDETKRFVLDRTVLDAGLENFGRISCASYRDIKYWVGIFDLDRAEGQWTFKNYQPLEADAFAPRYGQLAVIDDGGKLHRAFIGVYVSMEEKKGNLSVEMFCNSTAASEVSDFKSIFSRFPDSDGGRGIEDAYTYPTNDCDTKNCVKGPGQMLPTCQYPAYTYSKNAGDACTVDNECKSVSCAGGKCADKTPPSSLIEGQPCRMSAECNGGLVCAYDKRCRTAMNAGLDVSKFAFE